MLEEINNVIKQPKWLKILATIGIIFIIIFNVIMAILMSNGVFTEIDYTFGEAFGFVSIVAVPIFIVCIFTLVYTINWQLEVGENELVCMNLFKVKKWTYKYSDIEFVVVSLGIHGYKDSKRLFTVSRLHKNWQCLANKINAFSHDDKLIGL